MRPATPEAIDACVKAFAAVTHARGPMVKISHGEFAFFAELAKIGVFAMLERESEKAGNSYYADKDRATKNDLVDRMTMDTDGESAAVIFASAFIDIVEQIADRH